MSSFIDSLYQALPAPFATTRAELPSEIITVLQRYGAQLPLSPIQQQALAGLDQKKTCFVVTGQQVGFAAQPLLIVYKIAAAILLAKKITASTDLHCLPLFWLQSEDHDLAEVSTLHLPRQRDSLAADTSISFSIPWEHEHSILDNRIPMAELLLPDGLTSVIEELLTELRQFPGAAEQAALLLQDYRPGVSIVDACAGFLARVFADHPLIFFHPRLPGVAPLSAPLFKKAHEKFQDIASALLTHRDHNPTTESPIHIRSNSPLYFYTPATSDERFRLEAVPNSPEWILIGTQEHDKTTRIASSLVERDLTESPNRFSTSALLRPVLQNYLLPTLAYIGGPAELAYSKQAAVVARELDQPHAPTLLRPSVTLLELKAEQLLKTLGLDLASLNRGQEYCRSLLMNRSQESWKTPEKLEELLAQRLHELYAELEKNSLELDPTLSGPLEKTRNKINQATEAFLARYSQAIERVQATDYERLARLFRLVQPDGIPQERAFSPVYYLSRYGMESVDKIFQGLADSTEQSITIAV